MSQRRASLSPNFVPVYASLESLAAAVRGIG